MQVMEQTVVYISSWDIYAHVRIRFSREVVVCHLAIRDCLLFFVITETEFYSYIASSWTLPRFFNVTRYTVLVV